MRSRATVIAALMVERGEADAMICGVVGRYQRKLQYVRSVLALDRGVGKPSAMTAIVNDKGIFFLLDTHVQLDPTAEDLAEATLQATFRMKLFGIQPKVALLSHSNFGSHDNPSAAKMRRVRELFTSIGNCLSEAARVSIRYQPVGRKVVRPAGIEPAAPRLGGGCSIR